MALFDPRARLRAFTTQDWVAVQRVVQRGRFTLGQASAEHSLAAERLLAFLLCLEADELCQLYHRVYHVCEAHPIRTVPFRAGLPSVPFTCPECERVVERPDELSFDVECRIAAPDGVQVAVP